MPSRELRRKIGQMFLLGFEGRSVTPWVKELVSTYNVGGLVLFARNISEPVQAWELVRSLKSAELLKAIDHEGGRVVRLPGPVTRFPPAARLGEVGSSELVRRAARVQAEELRVLGFNLSFAPVLDVLSNPLNRVIGDRAFSSDASVVARLGAEWVRGSLEAGVAPCGKHFPGHGDTREDSHEVLPRVRGDRASLEARELLPFRAAFKVGLPVVMTAHVVVEGVDSTLPATLSPELVDGILRKEAGFKGVVVSDDLEMKGVSSGWDVEDRTLLALKAGVDVLMFCHTPEVQVRAMETVYRAVDGRIVRAERIERSYERIQGLKAMCRKVQPAGSREELFAVLNRAEHKALAASLG